MKQFFATSEKVAVENYPYGYKKTTAYFSVEFKKGKGFRSVFQTIDPKTGKLNNPKKGTYSPMMLVAKDDAEYVCFYSLQFNGTKEINWGCKFMSEHFDLFSAEEIQDIYAYILMMIKVDAKAKCIYCNVKFDDLKPYIQSAVDAVVEGYKSGKNTFDKIAMDEEAIENLKDKDYNPFKVTEYIPV